jgi:drug/metabolite transporter (DMT)-like permease
MPPSTLRHAGGKFVTQHRANALLVLIAIIWGTTFTIVHQAVDTYPALALIALRFALATAVFLPLLNQQRAALGVRGIMVGVLLGVLLFTGFVTQTLGLQYTTPARAGFITGLNVVLVPLLGLAFKQWPPQRAIVGVCIALIGLLVLSWGCHVPWLGCSIDTATRAYHQLGDVLVLACAFAFAMHIVAVSRWATSLPVMPVNTVQLLVVAVLASITTLVTQRSIPVPTVGVLGAALFLGVIATALVFALQLQLQRYTTATHTALIFALEPVFAALFSWLWTGEELTAAIWLGGSLMLIGVLVAEVPFRTMQLRRLQTGRVVEGTALDGDV